MTTSADEGLVAWPNDAPSVAALVDALLADSAESVVVVDHDANISCVNGAVEHLLGYSPESVVGSPIVAVGEFTNRMSEGLLASTDAD